MRYGRRRQPDPAEEAAEAESWLADYRASSEDSGDEFPSSRRSRDPDPEDPFSAPGAPRVPAPLFTDPPSPDEGPMPFGGGRVAPNYDEPTGAFGARATPPSFNEPTGAFNPPSREEPLGAFGQPRREEPTGGFGPPSRDEPMGGGFNTPSHDDPLGGGLPPRGVTPSYEEPTGRFAASPPRGEPIGGFNGFNAPSAGSGAAAPPPDEPAGGFNGFGAPPRAEPTGGFGRRAVTPSYDEPAGGFGAAAPTPPDDEPSGSFGTTPPPAAGPFGAASPATGSFGAASPATGTTGSFGAASPAATTGSFGATPPPGTTGSPFGSGSSAGTIVPRRPPAASPHPDEEPIFKPFDPSAPPVVPPSPPQEEPILKYMSPRERTGSRSTYGGRRRAPDQRSAAGSGPPATAPVAPGAPVTGPTGPEPSGPARRRRYREDEEPSTANGAPGSAPAGFAPEYQQPYPDQPAGFAESPRRPGFPDQAGRPGFPEPSARSGFAEAPPRAGYPDQPALPGRRELPSQPTYPEPAAYAESPAYTGPPGYSEAPGYAEPPGYAEAPGYGEAPGYAGPPGRIGPPGYREAPGYPESPGYGEAAGYTEPSAYPDAPAFDDPRQGGYRREPDYADPRYGDGPYAGELPYSDEPPQGAYPATAAFGAPVRQPELPAGPVRDSRERRDDPDGNRPPSLPPRDSMRTISPDTTGDMPRVSTTGSIPRVGSGNTGTTGRVAAVGSATTGSLPRISPGTTGSLRPVRIDPVRPASRRPSNWTLALTSVVVLIVLAVCGTSTYFVFQNESDSDKGGDNSTQGSAAVPARDISSRGVDPEPLTEAEVFPLEAIAGQTGNQYTILKKEAKTDCALAATDDLVKLLSDNGCSQVVRGTMKSSDGTYFITAGIFNLKDAQAAINAHENIENTVKAQKGRFTGLLAGAGTEVLVRAPMVLGWHASGHYLAYCVIARVDGQGFDAESQAARDQIQQDVLSTHLRDTIIGGRAQRKAGGAPSPSSS